MTDAEPIYQALFDMSANLAWADGGALAYSSRRVKVFDDLPAQPALCQAEHDETVTWKTNQEAITTLGASWLLYHQAGKGDDTIVPATTTNRMIAAVRRLFTQDTDPDGNQHLALNVGVDQAQYVYRAWIEGRIQKFQGDLDGQTLIVVPIKILVP